MCVTSVSKITNNIAINMCTLPKQTAPANIKYYVLSVMFYRKLPATPNISEFKRDSQMSKMVTTVPPCNPFNKKEWQPMEAF